MNRFAGAIALDIQNHADVIGFLETIENSVHYVCIDARFQPSDCIMAGAPSLQFFFEKRKDGWILLIFLDSRSTTLTGGFSPSPDNPLIEWVRKNVWEESKLFRSSVNSLEDLIEELLFYEDFHIPLLGYAASSNELFNELEELCETVPKLFSDEETTKIGAQSIVSNIIAVENQKYTDSSIHFEKYLIPSVGMGEMELWIGTNPSFFARVVEDNDTQGFKVAKKHLYHMVFFRICHYLSIKYGIRTYSISKMEKAFDLEGVSTASLQQLFQDLNKFNDIAKLFFIHDMNAICMSLGEHLLEWVQRFEKLSSFYNDANFISLLVYSLTDQDPNYFGITSEWMEKESKNLTLSLRNAINEIDHRIKKMLG